MKKEKKVWAITLIAFWALSPNPTKAQQDSVRSKQLEEVVITATKFPKNQRETGKVLSVIDQDMIRQSAGKDLAQLLNDQVGILVNGSFSNPGKDKAVYLRGASNAYTLVLLDGIPLNDPSGINGGAYDLRLIALDQVDRIEILKGSQSTLYGSDAIAGVINLITKTGGEKKLEGSATASYGSYNTKRISATIQGSEDIIDYQVNYSYWNTDGISEAKDENNLGNFDKDGATQKAFGAQLGIRPSPGSVIKPFLRVSQFNGAYDAGANADDRNNFFESQLITAGFTSEWKAGKGMFYALYANESSDRTYDGTFGKFEYDGTFQNSEVYWKYPLSTLSQLVAGLNYQQWQMKDKNAVEPDPDASIVSPFVSLTIAPMKALTTEWGVRYNHHSAFGDNITGSFNPSYLVRPNTKVFVNLSSGFKAPSLNQLYGQFGANRELKPEQSLSLDAGTQWNSADRKLNLRAVWFYRKIEDVIIYTGAFRYDNFDEQRDHGWELEADYRIAPSLRLQANYTYVTGEVRTVRAGQNVEVNNLFRRPKHSVGFSAMATPVDHLNVNLSIRTFGKRTDQYFDLTDFSTKTAELDPYFLVNVYIEYLIWNRASVFADVKNLLNADYQEVYGYSTLGLNAQAGVRVKF